MPELSLRPSSKGVLILAIVAAVILLGGVLGCVMFKGKLDSAKDTLRKKEQIVAESRQNAQKREKSRMDYLKAVSEVRFLEASVSTRDYIPTMLKQLEHLGRSVNLKVQGVRPDTSSQTSQRRLSSGAKASEGKLGEASESKTSKSRSGKQKPYNELKIDLELQGSYTNVLSFLYRLTTFPKIIAVNALSIQPGKEAVAGQSPILNVKMTVTAYLLPEDEPSRLPEASVSKGASTKGGAVL